MKTLFWKIHRYLGLILAPIFLVILLTGIIIAIGDIKKPKFSQNSWDNQEVKIFNLVESLDKQKVAISSIYLDKTNPQIVWISSDRRGALKAYSLEDGSFIKTGGINNTLYNFSKKLHQNLALGKTGRIAVEIASWAMILIISIGLIFIIKPKFSKSLISWHNGIGVFLAPFLLALPITAVMMLHHIYFIKMPKMDRTQSKPLPMLKMLENLKRQDKLKNVVSISAGKFGTTISLKIDNKLHNFKMLDNGTLKENPPTKTNWVRALHLGNWAGNVSKTINLIIALLLSFLLGSGVYSYTKRIMKNKTIKNIDIQNNLLVLYGSQTGNAERLANKTAEFLNKNNIKSQALALSALKMEELVKQKLVLFICSTTGDGEVPDNAKDFVKSLENANLSTLEYSILALGDSYYKNFCGGAKTLNTALQKAGAKEILPMKLADGASRKVWQEWIANDVSKLLNLQTPIKSKATKDVIKNDIVIKIKLVAKNRLDNAKAKREAWELLFEVPKNIDFQSGDLLLITPPQSQNPRSYSIGSNAKNGNLLRLSVGMNVFTNDKGEKCLGECSSWLINKLNLGEEIEAKLCYTEFHLENDTNPVIMIASGVGIAPMIGFLESLENNPQKPAWLFFGNTNRIGGYYYQEKWENALKNKVLTKLNPTFTEEQTGYVQDELLRNAKLVYEWIVKQNCYIFVCGRTKTVGEGVNQVLAQIFSQEENLSPELALAKVNELKENNRLRMDLFG